MMPIKLLNVYLIQTETGECDMERDWKYVSGGEIIFLPLSSHPQLFRPSYI